MGRRTTLGVVSPGGLNARRSSLGVSSRVVQGNGSGKGQQGASSGAGGGAGTSRRQSMRTPVPPPQGRTSIGGGTRRSSMYGKASAPGATRPDPRPISDKAYQQSCVRTIITYLSGHGYDNAVSPKQLSSPTTKDFLSIVTFLCKQVEPGFKLAGKVEDEVPSMFKRLRYPFSISKTALVAVGSPHTWPPLLAALTWLVELLNYRERALQVAPTGGMGESSEGVWLSEERDLSGDREFFEYVSASYQHFLAGNDDECAAVDDAVEAKFQRRDEETQSDVERIKKANEELQAELDKLSSEPSPKELMLRQRDDLTADIDKLEKLKANLQQHKGTLVKKIAQREADLAAKRQEMGLLEKETDGIRQRIATQSVNREDIVRMNNDRAKLQKALEATTQNREELDAQVSRSELALEGRMEHLEAAGSSYNRAADHLQLIPATAKRAAGVDFEMSINRQAVSPHDLLSVDLKGVIKPALHRLLDRYASKHRAARESLLTAREELGVQEELLAERREEDTAASSQVQQLEARHKAAREALETAISSTHAEVDKIQAEISGMQEAANDSVLESEERLAGAKRDLEVAKRNCEQEVAALNDDLTAALNCLVQHKLHVQDVLEQLEQKAGQTLTEVAEMVAPC